jgi:hypothetical protein
MPHIPEPLRSRFFQSGNPVLPAPLISFFFHYNTFILPVKPVISAHDCCGQTVKFFIAAVNPFAPQSAVSGIKSQGMLEADAFLFLMIKSQRDATKLVSLWLCNLFSPISAAVLYGSGNQREEDLRVLHSSKRE